MLTLFFIAAFVVLPLVIALVLMVFRSRQFFLNVLIIALVVLGIWGAFKAGLVMFGPETAPANIPASVESCLEWPPSQGHGDRGNRCSL